MWVIPGSEATSLLWEVGPGVRAGVSTRRGGASRPPFDTLNWSYAVGDDPQAVNENRRRVLAWAHAEPGQLVTAGQVHGAAVAVVGPEEAGRGPVAGVDGLLTSRPGTVVAVAVADCVPLLLAAPQAGWVGAIHAGWRGTAAKIGPQAVQRLFEQGVRPDQLWVGIGPSIGPCCYEVDEPVYTAITQALGSDRPLRPGRPGHWQLDLWLANQMALEAVGVPPSHIECLGWCTACRSDWFFSYRRDGPRSGRMGGWICLTSPTTSTAS